ncbi:MAG: alcohol dehydrogenase catalytic domain-containing protein [Armatimonadetes bacterium]|nr:alcohol dehydrogenase catalytic domain-containing protein [Armatimonadota bacterium]
MTTSILDGSQASPGSVSDVPTRMKSLILQEPGRVTFEEVPIPALGEGDLLVRVISATTCGTDLKAYKRGHPQIPMPGGFGHEYSGIVADAGPRANFSPGQAIMGVHSAPCGECDWCKLDKENLCESIMASKVLGSFAEYLVVPKRIVLKNVYEKPENISFDVASLLEPYASVAQGIHELRYVLRPDASVLVIGPGAIGLLFVAALKESGVANITLGGRNQDRLKVGAEFGAKTVDIREFQPTGIGFDIVIECTGQVEVWERSIDFVRRGGTLMLFGGCASGTRVSFDTRRVHYDQISILSPFHFGTGAVRQAREWILSSQSDLSLLISGERRLEEGATVFEDLDAGKGIKYVFHP